MTNLSSYYSTVTDSQLNYLQGLEVAKKEGYTHLVRWINSDLGWTFFAKSYDEANEGAANLYLEERGKKVSKGMTLEDAEKYYSEYVDIIEIDEEIKSAENE